jgi:GTP pyrophosphokinase
VFTPKGKVVNLKAGATPVDFAYAIHSEVSDHCKSAIVNEKLVPLRTRLSSGDVVEIITQINSSPSADWLRFVTTTRAKKRIMAWLQKEESAEDLEKGRRLWQKVLREYGRRHRLAFNDQDIARRLQALHYDDLEAFLRDVGGGRRTLDRQALKSLFPEAGAVVIRPPRRTAPRRGERHKLVSVEGQGDIDFTFAKCCHPIKGEEIIGYITKNRGLVVHRKSCPNVNTDILSRLKRVSWKEAPDYAYPVKLRLLADDKPGMLSTITGVIAACGSNIKKIEMEPASQAVARVQIVFEVRDMFQLDEITLRLRALSGVYSIQRRKAAGR